MALISIGCFETLLGRSSPTRGGGRPSPPSLSPSRRWQWVVSNFGLLLRCVAPILVAPLTVTACLVVPPRSRRRHPAISLEMGVVGQRKRVVPPLSRGGRHPAVSLEMGAVGLRYQLASLVTLLAV